MAADKTAKRRVHATLVATTVYKVNLTEAPADLTVINRTAGSEIFFTVSGTEAGLLTPTVGGNETFIAVPSNMPEAEVSTPPGLNTWIALISSGTPSFSIIAEG